jgi:hypothetical protein
MTEVLKHVGGLFPPPPTTPEPREPRPNTTAAEPRGGAIGGEGVPTTRLTHRASAGSMRKEADASKAEDLERPKSL